MLLCWKETKSINHPAIFWESLKQTYSVTWTFCELLLSPLVNSRSRVKIKSWSASGSEIKSSFVILLLTTKEGKNIFEWWSLRHWKSKAHFNSCEIATPTPLPFHPFSSSFGFFFCRVLWHAWLHRAEHVTERPRNSFTRCGSGSQLCIFFRSKPLQVDCKRKQLRIWTTNREHSLCHYSRVHHVEQSPIKTLKLCSCYFARERKSHKKVHCPTKIELHVSGIALIFLARLFSSEIFFQLF